MFNNQFVVRIFVVIVASWGSAGVLQGQRSIAGSTVGSPAVMDRMLQFASQHQIRPLVEQFTMTEANSAMSHVREGKPKYRVVLANN
ncbi:hypothetical protein N9Z58_01505 [bacterium]|nr:hypothetical protein [bacterium]